MAAWRKVSRLPAARQLPQASPGPLPAADAAVAKRFGAVNRTLWSQAPPRPHRDDNRSGPDNANHGH